MAGRFHLPIPATERKYKHLKTLTIAGTYHVLTAQDSTLDNPPDLCRRHTRIEWVEWYDIRPEAVERFAINLEMILVTWGDAALFDLALRIRLLNKDYCSKTCRCRKTDIRWQYVDDNVI